MIEILRNQTINLFQYALQHKNSTGKNFDEWETHNILTNVRVPCLDNNMLVGKILMNRQSKSSDLSFIKLLSYTVSNEENTLVKT